MSDKDSKSTFDFKKVKGKVLHYLSFPQLHNIFNLRAGDSMLFKGEEPVRRLTDFEYKLLKLLAQNMNQTVSREQIVQELWEGTSGSEQSLNNYVARLRKYLSEDESLSLETVPRTGYMLSILGTQPRVL
jgi:DNA-binding winged helix-turn-helix (wHTH) protein